MIICTERDSNFVLYKDKVEDRKVRFTIKQIFRDWWTRFLEDNPHLDIRDVVFKNVERMLNCKSWNLGYTIFKCDFCEDEERIVPHTCKSRACSSCGNKYNEQRSTSIFSKLFRCKHRHVVFTIPEDLRHYFRRDRKRLNLLFEASSITIKYWFKEKYKKHNLAPAFISVLHTFGRNLIFNPHIHVILMDGGISDKDFIKVDFFSYASFRKRFMKVLLDLLEKELGKDEFRKIKNNLYFKYPKGFYVFAPPSKFKSYIELVKYVCRYVARPVMAESRIIDYDSIYVTFWYQRHEDEIIVIEKIHVYDFIKRIIIHIPNHNFKQIRFYGAYHNSTKIFIEIATVLTKEKANIKHSLNRWRTMILFSFKIDPLKCSICNNPMVYYKSVYT